VALLGFSSAGFEFFDSLFATVDDLEYLEGLVGSLGEKCFLELKDVEVEVEVEDLEIALDTMVASAAVSLARAESLFASKSFFEATVIVVFVRAEAFCARCFGCAAGCAAAVARLRAAMITQDTGFFGR
jgi:hypothetical protein